MPIKDFGAAHTYYYPEAATVEPERLLANNSAIQVINPSMIDKLAAPAILAFKVNSV